MYLAVGMNTRIGSQSIKFHRRSLEHFGTTSKKFDIQIPSTSMLNNSELRTTLPNESSQKTIFVESKIVATEHTTLH
jgi:hypothetical protein